MLALVLLFPIHVILYTHLSCLIADAFRTILREEGFAALYKGIVPSLMLVSC